MMGEVRAAPPANGGVGWARGRGMAAPRCTRITQGAMMCDASAPLREGASGKVPGRWEKPAGFVLRDKRVCVMAVFSSGCGA